MNIKTIIQKIKNIFVIKNPKKWAKDMTDEELIKEATDLYDNIFVFDRVHNWKDTNRFDNISIELTNRGYNILTGVTKITVIKRR